jgi:RNA polymerase sigma-70 factor (ECF subfamily)
MRWVETRHGRRQREPGRPALRFTRRLRARRRGVSLRFEMRSTPQEKSADPGDRERPDESQLLAELRAGSEEAFAKLVVTYHSMLLRLARMYVSDRAIAEEVVQETWLGFLESLERFEGRSSIKTWIYRILINTAKKRRSKDRRSIPFSSLADTSGDRAETVDPDRFHGPNDRYPHTWRYPPSDWDTVPERRLLSNETLAVVDRAIDDLPPAQREVITMRDVEGFTSEEVRNALGITDSNQRVLLHRARSKIRRALEMYFEEERV